MNSRVVLAAIVSLSLIVIIGGCSSGAQEKSSPAANPSKPAVSRPGPSGSDGTGFSDREIGPFGLNLVWSYHHPNKIQQAYETNGNLYLVSSTKDHEHVLVKVDGASGLPRWTYPLADPMQFAPVVYVYPEELRAANADELFIVERGSVYCIDDRYGARNYKIACNFPISTSPAVEMDSLVVGGYDMRIYGLSKKNQFVAWTYLTGGGIAATPVISNARGFIGSEDGSLYALISGAGYVRGDSWSYKTLGSIEASPTIDGDRIYIASRDTKVHCVSDVGDESYLNWQSPLGMPVLGSPVISESSLFAVLRDDRYSGNSRHAVVCLDTGDGNERWRKDDYTAVFSASADQVWVEDVTGGIHALNVSDGSSRWRLDVSDSLEVLSRDPAGSVLTIYPDGLVQRIDRRR
ncbi:MAG: PQQ-binding-like beta-propeller repeat protein [Planctomycetota bacterium]|nr:PQQ-binding-like beta-propeller repeat protein [Planctomycetota bacterium]